MTNPSLRSAFTLVEMSIVLVVIGLLIGGVLVGSDMIKTAGIRAQIRQLDSFDAAAGTFFLNMAPCQAT
jgi:prepilin-type N-terminal cleavage/methylation domain-containing protein